MCEHWNKGKWYEINQISRGNARDARWPPLYENIHDRNEREVSETKTMENTSITAVEEKNT